MVTISHPPSSTQTSNLGTRVWRP